MEFRCYSFSRSMLLHLYYFNPASSACISRVPSRLSDGCPIPGWCSLRTHPRNNLAHWKGRGLAMLDLCAAQIQLLAARQPLAPATSQRRRRALLLLRRRRNIVGLRPPSSAASVSASCYSLPMNDYTNISSSSISHCPALPHSFLLVSSS